MNLPDRLEPGHAFPLGAHWDGLGANFAVFSAHAERIDLCLFDPSGRREIARLPLPEWTDEVWHGYLPDAPLGLHYGFRAHGPYQPAQGHRFNPHKLLLDPYARQISDRLRWSDALFGYRVAARRADLTYDTRDSAPVMPKAVLVDESFNWGDDHPPAISWSDTVIYEAHPRGLTMRREEIAPHQRGRFAALAEPVMIEHYHHLGITAIELLPIHAFVQDRRLVQAGLANYWGYNTLGFFAPEPRYFGEGGRNELKIAIRRLHAAGIEVLLDVVYNHTAEGSELGPTLNLRGLDNASYYRLQHENPRHCINDTGTGNTLNLAHPRVLQMVMDSLRYWVEAYHVDGFRFDLASTLGREPSGFDPGSGFFDAIRQDPLLAGVKLIAEPWDIGPGGYQLGQFPPGFTEWNDRFRDTVRGFWRGDAGRRAEIAARLAGSRDIFHAPARRPWSSVNYVASHDGFTLADTTAYELRHNAANQEDNRDGHGDNISSNWGAEGPTDDEAILAQRARIARAMLASVFLAQGTPMLLAGDEFGRTQQGNNNAYCQDNEISWIDWSQATSDAGAAMIRFTARLTEIRRDHPVLRAHDWLHGHERPAADLPDITWFGTDGSNIPEQDWHDGTVRCLALRRVATTAQGVVAILTVLLNASHEPALFHLPPHGASRTMLLDSADPDAPARQLTEDSLTVGAHSLVVLSAAGATTGDAYPTKEDAELAP